MISLDGLASLDCLQWLRTGSRAAEMLGTSQSSISREAKKCEAIFDIKITKRSSEWIIQGETQLLDSERQIHQQFRWDSDRPLRLDAQHWLRDSCAPLALDGWLKGNMNYLTYDRPIYLLRQRIIDAWLCCYPDAPNHSELASFQLCSMPSYLVVHKSHPLLERGSSLSLDEVRRYPLLGLPEGAFPKFQSMLERLGLSSATKPPADKSSYPIEDLLIGIASPLTLNLYGPEHTCLPINLPIAVGDALVVHSDYAEHPRTYALIKSLLHHLQIVTAAVDNIDVFDINRIRQSSCR